MFKPYRLNYKLIILSLYLSVNARIITLTEDNHVSIKHTISSTTASKFINDIEKIEKKSIYIYINSPGGSVHEGEKIIQYMEYKKHTNYTLLCIAHRAHSMAFHIYQHCTHRYVLPSSTIMQHQISLEINGQLQNIQNYIKTIEQINQRFIEIESKKLKISKDLYKSRISTDWWLYGNEIVDEKAGDILISAIGCHKNLMKNNTDIVVGSEIIIVSDCPLI